MTKIKVHFTGMDKIFSQTINVDIEEIASKIGTEIAKEMAIPKDLLKATRSSTWQATLDSQELLQLPSMPAFELSCKSVIPQTPYQKFCVIFIKSLKDEGYHKDIIAKVALVLDDPLGIEFIHSLSFDQMKDTNQLVQSMIDLYDQLIP